MNDLEQAKLVTSWIEYQKSTDRNEGSAADKAHWWAVEKIFDLLSDDPEEVWVLILKILERDSSDPIMEILSAGPLEDLLAKHGTMFISRVEEQARIDPKFRHLLGGVWKNMMTEDIWNRVETARLHKRW